MPRRQRHFLPDVPSHIVQRGNNRQLCFFTKRDYKVYLDKLREYSVKFEVEIHSFVLMSNHVHLLATPATSTGISQLMQSLGRYYVRYVNGRYNRTGTLWEGRFHASLVDSQEYLLAVCRYIELNPVRAGMVVHPAQYPWSSFRCNALGKRIRLVTKHSVYLALGSTPYARQQVYCEYFRSKFPESMLKKIRESSNKAWVLGSKRFKKQVERQLEFSLPPFPRGGDRRSKGK
tara:strand:- start:66707 stop:67402 length:696 start_codon:yes stop_codon:yes gene_type:complete